MTQPVPPPTTLPTAQLAETGQILQATGVKSNLQPDKGKRAEEKPLAYDAVYMHIAVQPAATVSNYTRSRLTLVHQLDQLTSTLRRDEENWKECGARSLSLDDGSRDRLVDMLAQGRVHCLVWSANGIGWEPPGNLPTSLSIEDLEDLCQSPLRPRVVVVCLKHGAEAAAARLQRVGVQSVIWLATDLLGSASDLILNALPQALTALHRGEQPHEVTEKLRNETTTFIGECVCNPSDPIMTPTGSALQAWPTVFPPRLLKDSNFDLSSQSSDRSLLACDQPNVDQLLEWLQQDAQVRSPCRIELTGTMPTTLQRRQAIAFEACIAHLHGKIYKFIWRVSTVEHLASVVSRLMGDRSLRALIWVDASAADAEESQLDAFVNLLGDTHHVLLTGDEGSEALSDKLSCHRELVLSEISAGGAKASDLHEEMTLYASDARADGTSKPHCLLDLYAPQALVDVIEKLLPGERSVAAIYRGDAGECVVRVWICDVARLHQLRDTILIGDFDQKLTAALSETPNKADVSPSRLSAFVDRTHFAERYEESILALEELTPHQQQKLAEGERAGENVDTHIMAPAGAGKTFVALHLMLRTLKRANTRVLFAAKSPAVCFFVAKWLAR